MGGSGDLLFVFCAGVALLGALGTVLFQNPLRAAMSLLAHIIALAGLFLTLHAHLLAALQLLVYAGAVVVLFIFVIMLLGPESSTPPGEVRGLLTRTASIAITALVTGGIAFSLVRVAVTPAPIPGCPDGAECGQFGGVEGFGAVLYREAVVPFELISILLTVAIVGAIAIARGRTAEEAKEARERRLVREREDQKQRDLEKRLSAEVSAHGGH